MVHAALLLLILEAKNADLVFTISLKRSTHYSQLSTSCPADYPIFFVKRPLLKGLKNGLGLAVGC